LTTPDDTTGIGYDFPGQTAQFGLGDPGCAISREIELSIRAYCADPPGVQGLTIQLFYGATQIAADYTIRQAGGGGDDDWANAVGDLTAHTYTIQYLGVALTAAEAATLSVKFTLTGAGVVVGISEVEAEVW
jgi:hypothetical protein